MATSKIKEQSTRRTYQKHKTEGVISVVHFLNTRLKPKKINGQDHYPMYLRITVKKQVTTIRSLLIGSFTNNQILKPKYPDTKDAMELEKRILSDFINNCNPFQRDDFHISEITSFHAELYNSINFLNLEVVTDWVRSFIEDFAKENKIDPNLFLSIVNLSNDNVFDVIEAFKKLSTSILMLSKMPNYNLEYILRNLIEDKKLYKDIIHTKKITKNLFIRLNNQHFRDIVFNK